MPRNSTHKQGNRIGAGGDALVGSADQVAIPPRQRVFRHHVHAHLVGDEDRGALAGGGHIDGIIPEFLLTKERAGRIGPGLIVTNDMHERKRKMFEMADAFVAMPGGIGTLEEIVEQMTWAQLGRHKKPILLANIENFWEPLCTLLDHMRKTEFIRAEFNFDLLIADRTEDILPMLQKAAASVSDDAKTMKTVTPEKLA